MRTIKGRVTAYNISILLLMGLTTMVIFNIAVAIYIENTVNHQLQSIADRAESVVLKRGPDLFKIGDRDIKPPAPPEFQDKNGQNAELRFYLGLDRALRETLSVLRADYTLLDIDAKPIDLYAMHDVAVSSDLQSKLQSLVKDDSAAMDSTRPGHAVRVESEGIPYLVIIKPVAVKNDFGLGWIIIHSSLESITKLQTGINLLLSAILLIGFFSSALLSSLIANRITEPFTTLGIYLNHIAAGRFGEQIVMDVDDEMRSLVDHVNHMSKSLEGYDKAQRTFMQNASHELRTPIMAIQSYAEGITYDVVEPKEAAKIIIEESQRLTHLVESLLYLSRLDALDAPEVMEELNLNDVITDVVNRMKLIAEQQNITLVTDMPHMIQIHGDSEKLNRAVCNLISNSIRYATSTIIIRLTMDDSDVNPSAHGIRLEILDDGPGFGKEDLGHLFDRFYKGEGGMHGLGLSIVKSIVEKHQGTITAHNEDSGAHVTIRLPI